MSLKSWTVLLLLLGPAWAAELQIRRTPSSIKVTTQADVLYAQLDMLCQEFGVQAVAAGAGLAVGEAGTEVPVGKVRVGSTLLDVWLEGGEVYVPAADFCLALGGKVSYPERTVVNLNPPEGPKSAQKVSRRDPASFFFTQVRSSSNALSGRSNGNCGPACLSMVALAFDRWPLGLSAENRPAMMAWCREQMGADKNESLGTDMGRYPPVAEKLKLNPKWVTKFEDIAGHLQRGRFVIVGGDIGRLGFRQSGGHAMLVVGQDGPDYLINDPGLFYKKPGQRLPAQDLRRFFQLGVAVGDD
ncbi:hypothetical protein IV102_00070 [bacterium]|nr:hypothetical protein [bacterium]